MIDEIENLFARDPQRSDSPSNGNSNRGSSQGGNGGGGSSGNNRPGRPLSSVVSVVFVTASPTFSGNVAGFRTISQPSPETTLQPEAGSPVFAVAQTSGPSKDSIESSPEDSAPAPAPTTNQQPQQSQPEPQREPQIRPKNSQQVASDDPPSSAESPRAFTTVAAASSSVASTATAAVVSSTPAVTSRSDESTATGSSSADSSSSGVSGEAAQSTSTSDVTAPASSSSGMSAGGKAGLAIGIIAILCLLAGAALWFYRKKKQSLGHLNADDEKAAGFGSAGTAVGAGFQTTPFMPFSESEKSDAPHLSLRPVTQFDPDLAGAKKRASQDNGLNVANSMTAAGANRSLTHGSPWERRSRGNDATNPFQDPANPFKDQAQSPPPPSDAPNVVVTPPASSDDSNLETATDAGVGNSAGMAPAAAAAGAGAAVGVAKAAGGGSPKPSPEASGPPRSGPGPGGALARPPPSVHRVQLAFKPSMDDELELRAGELIRVLHEYDDGWALCLRLDRSQQGVAPRTCLSARPVKTGSSNPPRINAMGPNGHPRGPAHNRTMTPNGGPTGPNSRTHSPADSIVPSRPGTSQSNRFTPTSSPVQQQQQSPGHFNQAPRPLSPGPVPRSPAVHPPKRSQSPGPYGANRGPPSMTSMQRRRSHSTSAVQARRNSPPGPSPLARGDPMVGWRDPKSPNPQRTRPGIAM